MRGAGGAREGGGGVHRPRGRGGCGWAACTEPAAADAAAAGHFAGATDGSAAATSAAAAAADATATATADAALVRRAAAVGVPAPRAARRGVRGRAPRAHALAPTLPAGLGAWHAHGGGFRGAGACAGRPGRPSARPRPRGARSGGRGRPRTGHAKGEPARVLGGEGAPRGPHGRGATGRGERAVRAATQRRNARPTAFWRHAARRQNSCSSATRETTPANPGRPG